MGRSLKLVIALLALLGPAAANSETVYVTDNLLLGLYDQKDASGPPVQRISSGTALEVLERSEGYVRVRTPDGTEGWVKSAYLVTETPPKLQLSRVQQANQNLTVQLEKARERVRTLQRQTSTLRQQVETLGNESTDHRSTIEALRTQNRNLERRLERYGISMPVSWAAAAAGVCLVLGLVGGYALLDYRIRRRHGGIRIR